MQNSNTTYPDSDRGNTIYADSRLRRLIGSVADSSLPQLPRQELLFTRFMQLLQEHAIERQPMTFYADKLCLSPDHFAKMIKKSSGRTVSQWISDRLLSEAKAHLRDPLLNIQQVADCLRFSDQSAFGKFFRKHTGHSPSSYRKIIWRG